jgi:hypothetical protein
VIDLYAIASAVQLAYGYSRQIDLHHKLVAILHGIDEAAIDAAVSAYWQAEQVAA